MPVRAMQDMAGVDVAMHQTLLVGMVKGSADVTQNTDNLVVGPRSSETDPVLEIIALNQSPDNVRAAFPLADLVTRNDVRMIQRSV